MTQNIDQDIYNFVSRCLADESVGLSELAASRLAFIKERLLIQFGPDLPLNELKNLLALVRRTKKKEPTK